MKTRNGFVSNSSSSSFIIFGVEVPRDSVSLEKFSSIPDSRLFNFIDDEDDGAPEDSTIIGLGFSFSDEDEFGSMNVDVDKLKKFLDELGVTEKKFKVFATMQCC